MKRREGNDDNGGYGTNDVQEMREQVVQRTIRQGCIRLTPSLCRLDELLGKSEY